jgi:AbrB family looped-hinge helix DNA binding protein
MVDASRIGKDGRITIPKAIQDRLGLKPDDRVEFVVEGGRVWIRRVENPV